MINDIKQVNRMKTNNVIMEMEVYEAPKCQVINLEIESAVLGTSNPNSTGSATHDGFVEDNYVWN